MGEPPYFPVAHPGWQYEYDFWDEYCSGSCYTMLTNVVSGTYENISSFYFQGDYIDAWA